MNTNNFSRHIAESAESQEIVKFVQESIQEYVSNGGKVDFDYKAMDFFYYISKEWMEKAEKISPTDLSTEITSLQDVNAGRTMTDADLIAVLGNIMGKINRKKSEKNVQMQAENMHNRFSEIFNK